MKKKFILLLGIILASMTVFTSSCDQGEDEEIGEPIQIENEK